MIGVMYPSSSFAPAAERHQPALGCGLRLTSYRIRQNSKKLRPDLLPALPANGSEALRVDDDATAAGVVYGGYRTTVSENVELSTA